MTPENLKNEINEMDIHRLSMAIVSLDNLLEKPEAKIKLAQIPPLISSHIIQIYEINGNGTDIIFLVGGKSRRITEKVLFTSRMHLPEKIQKDIQARIRLNNQENEALYAKESLGFDYKIPAKLIARTTNAPGPQHIVFIDDHMSSGRKLYRMLDVLNGIPDTTSEAIVLSGTRNPFMPEHLDYRPPDWQDMINHVYIPLEDDKLLAKIFSNISSTQSLQAKMRLSGQIPEDQMPLLQQSAEKIKQFHQLLLPD